MYVLTRIASYFGTIASFFNDIYVEVEGWVWPFYKAADFFWYIRYFFYKLEAQTIYFSEDMEDFIDELGNILSWSNIKSFILGWLPYLEDAIDWFLSWTYWIGQEIENWFNTIKPTIQGWIDVATQGFSDLVVAWDEFWTITFPDFLSNFDDLLTAWDNFWTVTFPSLVDFSWLGIWWDNKVKDIQELVEDTIKTWFPFIEQLQLLWNKVAEFITDPLQWLYDELDEFFERFW